MKYFKVLNLKLLVEKTSKLRKPITSENNLKFLRTGTVY